MAFNYRWDDEEKTMIYVEGVGSWTWDEFHQTTDEIVVMMQGVSHRVDLIIMGSVGSAPKGSGSPHYNRAIRRYPENFGIAVMVGHSMVKSLLVNTLLCIYKSDKAPMRLASNIDAARTIVLKVREEASSGINR